MKRVLVISSSLRAGSNSDILADNFIKGVEISGNCVEKINLTNKTMKFCIGCLSCQETGKCVLKDDVNSIIEKMQNADVIAFATPIYFYEMAGQMKVLLDRTNPLYPQEYKFRDIYLIATCAENDKSAIKQTIGGLQGWVDCFDKAEIKGVVYGIGVNDRKEVLSRQELLGEAYNMGKSI